MIALNYKDPRPIYEQIKFGLRRLIMTDVLQPNNKMPSVRELSAQLAINPNTVQRAYRELEAEGYIYSVPGKGSFVSPDCKPDAERMIALLKQLDEAVAELCYMGMSKDELVRRITEGGNKL